MNNPFRFGIRDLFFTILVASILIAWTLDKISTGRQLQDITSKYVETKDRLARRELYISVLTDQTNTLLKATDELKNIVDKQNKEMKEMLEEKNK